MAIAPYKINDRRSSTGWVNSGSDTLYDASRQSLDRPTLPPLDRDDRQNLSTWGWRQMLTAGRSLWANFGPIAGAIDQMGDYAIGQGFNVQSLSTDKKWANLFEEAIYNWDRICNVRGPNFNFNSGLRLGLKTMIRDGDQNMILTETTDGYPMIQNIPAHRIGNRLSAGLCKVEGGTYDGLTIWNGIIQDDVGRPLAVRIFSDVYNSSSFTDIAIGDIHLYFSPNNFEDCRGLTWLKACINDCLDIKQIRDWLKLVVKGESAIMLKEFNETGTPSPSQLNRIRGLEPNAESPNPTSPVIENLDGGAIRYFKMGKQNLESLNTTRPSPNAMEFQREILRGGFNSLNWPMELYDADKIGGAPSRQRIAQAVKTLEMLQGMAERVATDAHRYAAVKLERIGVLPYLPPDWWKMYHQRPRSLTVDQGYDVKADMELVKGGFMSMQWICDKYGEYWEEVQQQRVDEEKGWQERCAAASTGTVEVEPENVRVIYPNPPPEAPEETPAKGKTEE